MYHNSNKKFKYKHKNKINSITWKGLCIWGLATLFYFFDNLLNVSPSVMKPELSIAFNLTAADLGLLSSCYSWAYGLMQIPAGLLMDKFGPRRLFIVASLLCALGSFNFAIANSLKVAAISRILIGLGSSFAVVGCSKIATIWFSSNNFALFIGLMVSIGMLGAAFGLSTVNYVLQIFNWRETMYFSCIIALVLSFVMWLIIKDQPVNYNSKDVVTKNANVANKIPLFLGLQKIITSTQVWIAAIYAGLMFVPTLALGGLWGIPYLVEGHGFSREISGYLVSFIFIGWVFGGPLYGIVSDYLRLRNLPMYFANLSTLMVVIVLIYVKNLSTPIISVLMFLLGFFSSGFILAFAVTKEIHDHRLSGTAIGFINTINTFWGAGLQWLIGKILDVTTTNDAIINTVSTERIFSYTDYKNALLSIPICLILSLIVIFRLKETHCIPLSDDKML